MREPHALVFPQASLREIARDLGKPDELADVVMDRADDDVGPEHRPVLANPPGFVLEATVLRRSGELFRRLPSRDVFGQEESGEVFADDLLRTPSLDPLGTGIPRHDATLRIQHVERAVVDA